MFVAVLGWATQLLCRKALATSRPGIDLSLGLALRAKVPIR